MVMEGKTRSGVCVCFQAIPSVLVLWADMVVVVTVLFLVTSWERDSGSRKKGHQYGVVPLEPSIGVVDRG